VTSIGPAATIREDIRQVELDQDGKLRGYAFAFEQATKV